MHGRLAAPLAGINGTVATFGDNAYESGTSAEFARCYDPSWGQFKARTKPSVGDGEYETVGASGYFNYFGEAAGDPQKGYYSYDLGSWHIIVLNSNCHEVGGCGAGSPQLEWLQDDLDAHPATCTLAYWHHPLFFSMSTGEPVSTEELEDTNTEAFWQVLYDADADVVLGGHRHNYERFAPMDPTGTWDDARGMRQFIVGTGGAGLFRFLDKHPNSEVQNAHTFGVLKLLLRHDSYRWKFLPVATQTFTDSGRDSCH